MTANIIYDTAFEDTGQIMLGRIRGSDAAYVTQASLTSITCAVVDITTGSEVSVITPSIVIATVIFDTLQTGSLWTVDSTGYNFKHAMPATAFPDASHVYKVTYTATPVSGAVFKWQYQITAK